MAQQKIGLSVKSLYQKEYRRFILPPTNLSFCALADRVCSIYTIPRNELVLKWVDEEGDEITLLSETDLEVVPKESLLHLIVSEKSTTSVTENPAVIEPDAAAVEPDAALSCKQKLCQTMFGKKGRPPFCHPRRFPEGHPHRFPEGHPRRFPEGHPRHFPEGHPRHFPEGHPHHFPEGHPHHFPEGRPCGEGRRFGLKWMARLVKDVTITKGTEIEAGTHFVKTWRFRNEDSEPWPANCTFEFCSRLNGDSLGGKSTPIPVSPAPGEEIDVSVEMVAPTEPGKYVGHWRLALPDGRRFGQHVKVSIFVPSHSSSEECDPIVDVPAVTQLEEMGFSDTALIRRLLKVYHWNVEKVIKRLLRIQRQAEKKAEAGGKAEVAH